MCIEIELAWNVANQEWNDRSLAELAIHMGFIITKLRHPSLRKETKWMVSKYKAEPDFEKRDMHSGLQLEYMEA